MSTSEEPQRSYWVWITKPEFYLNADGEERECLTPDPKQDHDFGWWTCHKETKMGDLALLYRTKPKSDIAFLLEAKSDARVLEEEPPPGVIFANQFQRAIDSACAESPDLISEGDEIDAEVEELQRREEELADLLSSASSERDSVLARDYIELLSRIGRLHCEIEDLDPATSDEVETRDNLKPEGVGHSTRRDALIAELDRVIEIYFDFRGHASAESKLFREVIALEDLIESQTETLETRTRLFDAEVFRQSGLPESTVVVDDPPFVGRFVCDWVSRYKFEKPLALKVMKQDPHLAKDWGALRANFKGSAFRIPSPAWRCLIELSRSENSSLEKALDALEGSRVSPDIVSEKEIEDYLCDHLEVLAPKYQLQLYTHSDGRNGRQFACPDAGGFIDLLCLDSKAGEYVVIELKSKRAGRDAVGQIKSYMGWVKDKLAGGSPVRGLIISDGYDRKLRYALMDTPRIEHLDLSQIGAPRPHASTSPKSPTQRLE